MRRRSKAGAFCLWATEVDSLRRFRGLSSLAFVPSTSWLFRPRRSRNKSKHHLPTFSPLSLTASIDAKEEPFPLQPKSPTTVLVPADEPRWRNQSGGQVKMGANSETLTRTAAPSFVWNILLGDGEQRSFAHRHELFPRKRRG